MPLNTPLDSDQLDAHRGTPSRPQSYFADILISVSENAVVYSARINQTELLKPLAELSYDGGSGDLSKVMIGMTVFISHTSNIRESFFRGRVRLLPTSDTLYINENGAPLANDDYIWILDDFDTHRKLPRYVAGEVKLDWDQPVSGVPPLISDLQAVYVGDVDTDSGVLTVVLHPTVDPGESGETIASVLWTLDDSSTITDGSTTEKDITVDFGPGEHAIHLTVTDTADNVHTLHIKVFAHDADHPPTALPNANLTISCEIPTGISDGASQGYSASCDVFAGLSDLLPRTLVVIWVRETYSGVPGSQVGNILMVGRTRSEQDDTTYSIAGPDAQATVQVEGALAILASIKAPSFMMMYGTGTSDIAANIKDLTIWRAVWFVLSRFSTFGEVWPVSIADMSNDFIYDFLPTQGGDLLASVSGLAQSINAVLQMDPDGRVELARRAVMLDSDARDALDTIADLGHSDILEKIGLQTDYRNTVAQAVVDGGSFDGSTLDGSGVTAWVANAPPGAPDEGPDDVTLNGQILKTGQTVADEQAELATRAGNALAASQPVDNLSITLFDGWHHAAPAVNQWWTLSLDGTELVGGQVFTTDTRLLLQSIELTPDVQTGQIRLNATFTPETSGDIGETRAYPPADTGKYGLGDLDIGELPPIDTSTLDYDFTGASDGNWVISVGTHTPGTGVEGDCDSGVKYVDMYKDFGTPKTSRAVRVTYDADYTGGEDGKNRIFARAGSSAHWFELGEGWTTVSGSGQVHIVEVPAGLPVSQVRVLAYAGADCDGSITITDIQIDVLGDQTFSRLLDFRLSKCGFEAVDLMDGNGPRAVWVPGVGWQTALIHATGDRRIVDIRQDIASTPITSIVMTYSATDGTKDIPVDIVREVDTNLGTYAGVGDVEGTDLTVGATDLTTITLIDLFGRVGITFPGVGGDPGGEMTITKLYVTGNGEDPFA